jgi:hypothetical protein
VIRALVLLAALAGAAAAPHGAIYGPHGPRIVVVLTYRPGLDAQRAAVFGRRVARLLR